MFKRKSLSNIVISIFLMFGSNLNSCAMGNNIVKVKRKSPSSLVQNDKKENINFNSTLGKEDTFSVDENEVKIKDQSETQYAANNPLGEDFRWNNHIPGFSGQKLDSDTSFLDFLHRDTYVKRWNNLNSRESHNLSEHSAHTAYVAHFLALLKNKIYENDESYEPLDPYRAATLALYHDSLEILTGDMPTTTKYRINEMKPIYSKIENLAASEFIDLVPTDFKEHYKSIILPDKKDPHDLIVKEADIITNYIISLKEVRLGARDFIEPCRILRNQIDKLAKVSPEVKYFVDKFLPRFERRHYNLRKFSYNPLKKKL